MLMIHHLVIIYQIIIPAVIIYLYFEVVSVDEKIDDDNDDKSNDDGNTDDRSDLVGTPGNYTDTYVYISLFLYPYSCTILQLCSKRK